jgi:hypothetical protein
MQMSKNQPRVKARDGKSVGWNSSRQNKLKTVIFASCGRGALLERKRHGGC